MSKLKNQARSLTFARITGVPPVRSRYMLDLIVSVCNLDFKTKSFAIFLRFLVSAIYLATGRFGLLRRIQVQLHFNVTGFSVFPFTTGPSDDTLLSVGNTKKGRLPQNFVLNTKMTVKRIPIHF